MAKLLTKSGSRPARKARGSDAAAQQAQSHALAGAAGAGRGRGRGSKVKRRPGRGPRRQADGEIAVVGRKAIKARVDRGAAAVRAVHGLKPGVPLGAELWRRSTARLIA